MKFEENNLIPQEGSNSEGNNINDNFENEEIQKIIKDISNSNSEEYNNDNDLEDPGCPMEPVFDEILDELYEVKPFGCPHWTLQDKIEFLKSIGYSILRREAPDGTVYDIAVKSQENLPDYNDRFEYEPSNVFNVEYKNFTKKLVNKLSNWLNEDDKN